ncbi:hypothetical protein [Pandoraea sp. PE-S2R-1]|uniref:hypothetical protein n=1 Tax=Pandoraea sp. PE-S2R-1 TaxID=1986994 RepID=UPI0011323C27|nr:hypothetical protein [Pandoraea sp. PE-S2R-1]
MDMQSKQRGVFLIGATIAVAIVGMLLTLWMNQTMQEMRIKRAENIGASLQVIGEGVQSFIVKHHGEIGKAFDGTAPVPLEDIKGLSVDVQSEPDAGSGRILRLRIGAANPAEPTAADIIRIMKLPGVGDKPPMLANADYVIRIFRRTGERDIHAIIFINRPLRRTYGTDTDWNMMSTAVRQIGVHGGFSKPESPDRFTFPLTPSSDTNTPNDLPNPTPGAGLLAIRAGYLLSPLNSFLRRDGSQAMQGDLQMGGKEIVGIKAITGEGRRLTVKGQLTSEEQIVAQQGMEASGGNVLVGPTAQQLLTNRLAAEADAGASGHLATQGWAIAGKGIASGKDVVAAGKVQATGDIESLGGNVIASRSIIVGKSKLDHSTLTLGAPIDLRDSRCSPVGQIGRDSQGMFYTCQNHAWASLKGERGYQGNKGDSGRQGDTGPMGPAGRQATTKPPRVTYYKSDNGCVGSAASSIARSLGMHHLCAVSAIIATCGGSYNPKVQVMPKDASPFDKRSYTDKREWVSYVAEVETSEAVCLDFD